MERDTTATYDYVWEYLDKWKFPAFSSTKIKSVEYIFKTEFYKELPSARTLAKDCANIFLDSYYERCDLDDEDAVTEALISSYVKAIGDKYSTYRSKDAYSDYKSNSSGTLVGIGVNVVAAEGGIYVGSVYEGSPAEVAGIKAGDLIVAVDGTRIAGMEFYSAADLISGEIGTTVDITVLRNGEEITLTAMRAMITEKTVLYSVEDGIGYIRITSFKNNTAELFFEAIDYMKACNVNGVIYDLRANLGGYLHTVIDMLEYLAPKGTTLVSFSNGYSDPVIDETEHSYTPYAVVLTDYNTASAAELFTAGVKDLSNLGYGNAISVGKTTRGKGIMQSTYVMTDGSAVTLTVAYYNPPSGINYHEVGIAPDVEVEYESNEVDTQLERAYTEINKLINN